MKSNSRILTVDIDDAIHAVKLLKKASIHTNNFMVNHSRLTALRLMKEWGITRVQLQQ
jgi:hypothetical protein